MNRTMKNFALLIGIFLIMPLLASAQPTDTLIKKRNELYQRHSQRVAMLLDSSQISLSIMVSGLDSLVKADNQILDEGFPALKSEIDTLKAKSNAIVPLSDKQQKLIALYDKYEQFVLPVAGGIAFLIILLFVLLIVKSSSSKKKRKKLNKRIKELESFESTNDELTKELEEKQAMIEKHDQEISSMNAENSVKINDQIAISERLKTELNESNTKIEKLKQFEIDITELNGQLKSLQNEIDQQRENNNKLNEQIRQFQDQQLAEGQDRERLMNDMRNELNQTRTEKNLIEVELSSLKLNATTELDKATIRSLEDKLRDLEEDKYRMKEIESDLNRRLISAEQEFSEYKENQRRAQNDNIDVERLSEQLEEARQMLDTERKFRSDVEILLKEILNRKQ